MKLFENRIFNPDGLMIVLINASVLVLAIGLLVSMICFPLFWTITIAISLIVGAISVIAHWIWEAFSMIFPKRD